MYVEKQLNEDKLGVPRPKRGHPFKAEEKYWSKSRRIFLNFVLMYMKVFQVLGQVEFRRSTRGIPSSQNIQHGPAVSGFSKFGGIQHTFLDSQAPFPAIIARFKVRVAQVACQFFKVINNIGRRFKKRRVRRPRLNRTSGVGRGRRPCCTGHCGKTSVGGAAA